MITIKSAITKKLIISSCFLSSCFIGGALLAMPGHADTKYHYDDLGRLVKVEYRTDSGTKYFYDAAGNRIATVTDDKDKLDQLSAPPKALNMISLPLGGMSLVIF